MDSIAELERQLLALLKGEHSSLHLTFNDHSSNYETVEQCVREDNWNGDWISEEEMNLACAQNRAWTLQWYPDTPIGSYAMSASSLPALLDACLPAAHDAKGNSDE